MVVGVIGVERYLDGYSLRLVTRTKMAVRLHTAVRDVRRRLCINSSVMEIVIIRGPLGKWLYHLEGH